MKKLKLLKTGELLDYDKVSFNSDIEQWSWSFSLELPDLFTDNKVSYPANAAEKYTPIEITVGAQTWKLIAETPSSNGTQKNYSVSGRSITALLAEPHASQISQTWAGVMASAIVQEMCDLAGIILDWQIEDWLVENYVSQKMYPVDIIKFFVDDGKTKIQTQPDGTLSVVYWYSKNPVDLAAATPDYEFSTDLLIFDRSKTRENRSNENRVLVTTDNAANNSSPTPSIEESDYGDDKIYIVRCDPFFPAEVINLQHKSTGKFNLTYIGAFAEQTSDDLIIKDGAGQLSKQFQSLVGVAWNQDAAGSLSIAADGKIKCSGQDIGLVTVTYLTKYLKYQGHRTDLTIEKTLLFTDDIQAVASSSGLSLTVKLKDSAGDKVADPIIVKTLSNVPALLNCGLAYLWRNGFDVDSHSLDIPYMGTPVLPGSIAQVSIVAESLIFNCFVKSVSLSYGNDGQSQQITLDRPLV